jgi:hypothetical protein
MNKKSFAIIAVVLALVSLFFIAPLGSAGSASWVQMTPGTDPMSAPTSPAPTAQPYTMPMNPGMAAGTGTCPMMTGTMADGTAMGSMPGMGMSMGSMPMGSMGQMGSMPMGGMPMSGMQGMNDALSGRGPGAWFYGTNPWWLLGWLLLLGLVAGVLASLVLGVVWIVRRRESRVPVESN